MADIDMDWIPSGWNCGLHKYNREKWLTTSWSNNNMKQRMIHVHCGSVVYTLRRPIINWTNSFHERSREHFVFVCVVWNKFESLLCAIYSSHSLIRRRCEKASCKRKTECRREEQQLFTINYMVFYGNTSVNLVCVSLLFTGITKRLFGCSCIWFARCAVHDAFNTVASEL